MDLLYDKGVDGGRSPPIGQSSCRIKSEDVIRHNDAETLLFAALTKQSAVLRNFGSRTVNMLANTVANSIIDKIL